MRMNKHLLLMTTELSSPFDLVFMLCTQTHLMQPNFHTAESEYSLNKINAQGQKGAIQFLNVRVKIELKDSFLRHDK